MFDQLVESSGKKKDTVTFLGVAIGINALLGITTILLAAVVVSLFSFSLLSMLPSIDDQDLELTTLVAPPPAPQPEVPKPEQPKDQPKQTTQVDDRQIVTRTELQTSTDDPRLVPKDISPKGNSVPPIPPQGNFQKGPKNLDPSGGPIGPKDTGGGAPPVAPKPPPTPKQEEDEGPAPPPKTPPPTPKLTPTPTPTPKPPSGPISGGVVNGKATNLVKPAYPPAAKAVRASGAVNVQVVISETGSVISATAVSGHPLLRAAAEQAARASKFSPTQLSGQPVKVSGTIVYNFVAP